MKKFLKRALVSLAILAAVVAGLFHFIMQPFAPGQGVGGQDVILSDPADKPLEVHIWYPVGTGPKPLIIGGNLPLIVISHGTGGNNLGHVDTAIALAKAGFVVAAVTHAGDNYRDLSYVGQAKYLVERPRHVSLLISYMLSHWANRSHLDPGRIGMFGHSAGGFTGLVLAGGSPDLSRTIAHCRSQPKAWDCLYWHEQGTDLTKLSGQRQHTWTHDPRIKALAIAAPAIGYSFEPNGVAAVHIPLQMWEAQHDSIVDDSATTVRHMLPPTTEYHMVPNAEHFSFLMPCNTGMKAAITVMGWFGSPRICEDPAGFDRAKFHGEFNQEVVRFFATTLTAGHP